MMSRARVTAFTAAYLAIALAYTWPLAAHLSSGIAHDRWDPLLNAWIMWWSSTQALPLTAAWWNAPAFYPATGVLAFSEHLFGQAPIAAPLIALTHSAVTTYNVTLIATFVLSALGAHVLGFTLTRRHDAAFIAALAYAFAPYRVAQLPHLQVLSSYGAPFCLAALHRYDESKQPRWAMAAAAAWLVQALSCGYYMLFLSVLLVLWAGWFAAGRWSGRQWLVVGAAFMAAGALVLPFLLGYHAILHDTYGYRRSLGEIRLFSADAAALLQASDDMLLWGWLHVVRGPESQIFPGLTILVLAVWAVLDARPTAVERDTPRARRLRWILVAIAALFAVATVIPLVFGSWRLVIGGVRLISIGRADKPMTLLVLTMIAACATLPSVRAATRRRARLLFYMVAALMMWAFALGPDPLILGERLLYQAPYGWLMRLPGFDGLRVPARFWMMATLCLATLGALAIQRLRGRHRRIVVTIAAVCILLDGWPRTFDVIPLPGRRPTPHGAVTRLDLPSSDDRDPLALYQQTFDRVPLYNGYSGYGAPHLYALRQMLEVHDPRILRELTRPGPMGVVIDRASDEGSALQRFVAAFPGATLTRDEAAWVSYKLPATRGAPPPDVSGTPLAVKALDAVPSAPHATRALDGDLRTRWSGGPQRAIAEFTVELAQSSHVSQVVPCLGEFMGDYPRQLRVDVSADGSHWDTAFVGDTVLLAYYGAVRHPREIPIVVPIDRDNVRFIRLQQSGVGDHDWSIAEISVRN